MSVVFCILEFGNFNKTHGIWFAQVLNSLILIVKDISIFAVKISPEKIEAGSVSFVYVIVTNHINWHRENLQSNRENSGCILKCNLNGYLTQGI